MLHHAIKHIRQDKNLTQEEVAERLNIAPKTYARLESGETRLDWDRIRAIAEVYEMSPEELVAYDSTPIIQTFNNNDESTTNLGQGVSFQCNYYNNEREKEAGLYEQLIAQLREEVSLLRGELERYRRREDERR